MAKRFLVLIIILLAISCAISAILSLEKLPRMPKTKIIVDAYASEYAALVYIAKNKGYFAKEGLDVEIKDYEAGKLALEAFLAGGADIATCADAAFVPKSFKERDLRILAVISIFRTHGWIARKDHGITGPKDLKGKKIGVTKESSGEFFFGRSLPSFYLSPNDVEVVDLKPSEIEKAFISGEIDAACTWEPVIYDVTKRLPHQTVTLPAETMQDFYFLLVAKEGWLKANPKAATNFLKALLQAEEFAREDVPEAKMIIQRQFHRDAAFMDYVWPEYDFNLTLSQSLILILEDIARWRIENKLTEGAGIPNYLNYLYIDALEKVKPEAVTIIH